MSDHIVIIWWVGAFPSQPFRTWFAAPIPKMAWGWPGGFPFAYTCIYSFYKIPAENGHKEQLVIKSPVDRVKAGENILIKANVYYLVASPGDTPNWGTRSSTITVSPPCGNWWTSFFEVSLLITRSQTSTLNAAVQGNRDLSVGIKASVVQTSDLVDSITAAVQGYRQSPPIILRAGVQGNISRDVLINAAVAQQRDLAPSIKAAVAKDSDLPINIQAAVCGNPQINIRTRAAVRGEAQKSSGIIAYVVVSRGPQIYLEMENLVPQEFDLRSTPNWSSKIKDWRKDTLGK